MFGKTIIALANLVRSGKVNLSPVLDSPRFQSTHPRGVRLTAGAINLTFYRSFNPRTHEGCDTMPPDLTNRIKMFQSTHPRGVRRFGLMQASLTVYWFQSTHPRGVRLGQRGDCREFAGFNPRTHEGCDKSS